MPFPPSGQASTLASYRTELRRLLHDATGKFWSDSELNDYINQARFRVAADTGCIRSLVTAYLSTGLEQYTIGGVTGGLVTNVGSGYSFMNVTVTGDGSGATAVATLLPATATVAGGPILAVQGYPGNDFTSLPTLTPVGDGSGAVITPYLTMGIFATVLSLGTGYKVGQVLTLVGGTFTIPAQAIVTQVGGGGAIVSGEFFQFGQYSVVPTGSVALSGGTGTGAAALVNWGVGATVTTPGTGWTQCAITVSGGGGANADLAGVVGPLTAHANGLAQIIVTNPGTQYTNAQFVLSGDGSGAAATASVIPFNTTDIMNISPIWGNQRPPLNYQPWTEFNAKSRLLVKSAPGLPRVWSRYGTSGGAAFMQPIPDQPYVAEFDTAVMPPTLTTDTQADTIQYPYTSPVCYYAAWKAKLKQQSFAEAESFLSDYKRDVMFAQAAVAMRRIPNPYAGYSGG